MDPRLPNMPWNYLDSRGHQVNGVGLMNVLAIGIFSIGIRDFISSLLKIWAFLSLYVENVGYSHLISTGNGFTDIVTTPCTMCWIMPATYFDPFHHAPWLHTDTWRYWLLCQCHHTNSNGLWYDTNRVESYSKGRQLMLIPQNQSMTPYMISSLNGKIAGHWQTVSFPKTPLWLYRLLSMEWLSWSVMVPINPSFLPRLVQCLGFWNARRLKHLVSGNVWYQEWGMKWIHINAKFKDVTWVFWAFLHLPYIMRSKVVGSVDFHFNNDDGLNQSAAGHLNVTMKLKHGNLIKAIQHIVYKLKLNHSIQVQFVKVKGHKTDFIPICTALRSRTVEQADGYSCQGTGWSYLCLTDSCTTKHH